MSDIRSFLSQVACRRLPGSGCEDYVVSAAITAIKPVLPGDATALSVPKPGADITAGASTDEKSSPSQEASALAEQKETERQEEQELVQPEKKEEEEDNAFAMQLMTAEAEAQHAGPSFACLSRLFF